jgi:hypothetical protein
MKVRQLRELQIQKSFGKWDFFHARSHSSIAPIETVLSLRLKWENCWTDFRKISDYIILPKACRAVLNLVKIIQKKCILHFTRRLPCISQRMSGVMR